MLRVQPRDLVDEDSRLLGSEETREEQEAVALVSVKLFPVEFHGENPSPS
jgi:hypothetical protein